MQVDAPADAHQSLPKPDLIYTAIVICHLSFRHALFYTYTVKHHIH